MNRKIYRYISIFGLIGAVLSLGTLFFKSNFWQSFWNTYKDIPVEKWPASYLLFIGAIIILLMNVFMAVFNRIRYESYHD